MNWIHGIVQIALVSFGLLSQQEPRVDKARVDQLVMPIDLPIANVSKKGGEAPVQRWRLADHKGSIVILSFLSSTCGHSRDDVARLKKLLPSVEDSGVTFAVINSSRSDTAEAIANMMNRKKLSAPILSDSDGAIARYFKVQLASTYVIIDREGKMRYTGAFGSDIHFMKKTGYTAYLPDVLKALIDGNPLPFKKVLSSGCVLDVATPK